MINNVPADKLNKKAAEELAKKLTMPDWAFFVKTGVSRERPPDNADYYFIRAASILRRIYLDGPVGIERLRSYYGSRKNLGHKPSHFRKSGGKVIRTSIQGLEKLNYLKKEKKGRVITKEGKEFLDSIAKQISDEK